MKKSQDSFLGGRVVRQDVDVVLPIAKDHDMNTRSVKLRKSSLQLGFLLL